MTKASEKAVWGLLHVLSGSWRRTPPRLERLDCEWMEVAPLLMHSGAGALGWWRLRNTQFRFSPHVITMGHIYGVNTLRANRQQAEIESLLTLLRSAGVEPLLVKGWAVARMYPEPGLRPTGDIDLCVKDEQFAAAESVLKSPEAKSYSVDLHKGFAKLDLSRGNGLYERAQIVRVGGERVRIPSLEDHLRLLCFHLLRHGVSRPVWLCDVALLLESLPPDFNWEICLGGNPRRADWVACAIGLAHHLLGVKIDETPFAQRAERLPSWLVPSVIEQWRTPKRILTPMVRQLRTPLKIPAALRERWPNPIEATIGLGRYFKEGPRLQHQIRFSLKRLSEFLINLPKALR